MQYNEEFDERDDVLKYQAKGVSFYFVPNENDKYEFCTKEESDEDCRVSLWMSSVKRKEVTLNSIPFVIRDGLIKGAKKEVTKEEFEEIREDVSDFCNSITDDYEDDDCENVYVIDKAGDYSFVDFSDYDRIVVKGEIEGIIKFGKYFNYGPPNHTLSGVLDLRGAKDVKLFDCNLSKVTKIIFGEGAVVGLSGAKNLPKDLDVSRCDYVGLYGCDLDGIDLEFREGSEVCLWHAKNLPTNLDVSMCDKVDLRYCDLDGIDLEFREGAVVYLADAKNLPKDLDVSMCDFVYFAGCDLERINLRFKNEEQLIKSLGARVTFTDDENKTATPVISKRNDGR